MWKLLIRHKDKRNLFEEIIFNCQIRFELNLNIKKKQILYQVAVVLFSIKRGTPQQLLEVSRMFHKHLPAKKGKENNP